MAYCLDSASSSAFSFESFENSWTEASSVSFSGFTVTETNGTNFLYRSPPTHTASITHGDASLFFDDNGALPPYLLRLVSFLLLFTAGEVFMHIDEQNLL